MTPTEFEYCQRAMKELEKPLTLMQRIKIQRTMAQILNRSAERMEETFLDSVEARLYKDPMVDSGIERCYTVFIA